MLGPFLRNAALVGLAAICASAGAQPAVEVPAPSSADHRKVDSAVGKLARQRPGVVDAYVVVVSLDDDPVFGREARESARVLSSRFDASGRTILLAENEGPSVTDAAGSPSNLSRALTGVASVLDPNEDVLVVYSTSHGRPGDGLIYKMRGATPDTITSYELATMLNGLRVRNRLVILQACYSGQFIPALASDGTIVITAAARDRSSFGCTPGNDWTFFGHAFVNQALRQPAPLFRQFSDAQKMIATWEGKSGFEPSRPQISIGRNSRTWLQALEARAPKSASPAVGQPPSEISQ
jgi:hypothetical protein